MMRANGHDLRFLVGALCAAVGLSGCGEASIGAPPGGGLAEDVPLVPGSGPPPRDSGDSDPGDSATPAPPSCGDGHVDSGETCDPPMPGQCSASCQVIVSQPPPTSCPDGVCNNGETSTSCPADCPPTSPPPSGPGFSFVAWGDTKSGTSTLTTLSNQVFRLAELPTFAIYTGDLVSSGFDSGLMNTWKGALNGGSNNGMFDITFPIRGNHDDADLAGWQGFFDFPAVVASIGAVNYTEMSGAARATYSFDYMNVRLIAVDVTGSTEGNLDSAEIAWIDGRLTDAETRSGLEHAFLYWHGPIYPVGGHMESGCSARVCSTGSDTRALVQMLNRHPILSATFHGHEHSLDWTHLDSTRIPEITHPFEQFVTGGGGAGTYDCLSYRYDQCFISTGYMTVRVVGRSFTVSMWRDGDATRGASWERTFTK